MKKKILALVLVLVLLLTAVVGGTLAYFTDTKEAKNTFTLGNVKIELDEGDWKDPTNVAPGITYAKEPVVKNVGINSAWIRVNVTLSDAPAFIAAAEAHGIKDLSTVFTVAEDFDQKWTRADVSQDAKTLTYSYYWNTELAPGEKTDALFTAVTIPAAFNSEEMAAIGADFTITVTAHAIQVDGLGDIETAFAAYDAAQTE